MAEQPPQTERALVFSIDMTRIFMSVGPPWNEPVPVALAFNVLGQYDAGGGAGLLVQCTIHYADGSTFSPGPVPANPSWNYSFQNVPPPGSVPNELSAQLLGSGNVVLANDGPVAIQFP